VDHGSTILKEFDRRVADYVKLHKTAQSQIQRLKPTKSPEAIEQRQHGLAHAIREERRGALPGNIFTPEVAAEFRRLIGVTMHGAGAAQIRESLKRAEPVWLRHIRIDASYPAGIPLESTPPSLLLNLPALPPELEYRVVGHSLILRDIEANLIVDFIGDPIR
jgi:hypothetical protein